MRCILHIGPPKTGSTSIQYFLNTNREDLAEQGFYVPLTPHQNMSGFHFAVKETLVQNRAAQKVKISAENFEARKARIRQQLTQQFKKAQSEKHHSFLVTSEGIGQMKLDELQALKDWMGAYFDSFQIVPVLRRQDLRAISYYKNQIMINFSKAQKALSHHGSLDYDLLLTKFETVFGQEAITPLLFPDSVEEDRDLIADYCQVAGIEGFYDPATMADDFKKNPSMDARGIEVLRLMNEGRDGPLKEAFFPARKFVERLLAKTTFSNKRKVRPARADVAVFCAKYAKSNERIRKTYFPQRSCLFWEDYTKYPEVADYPVPDGEFVAQLFLAMESHPEIAQAARLSKKLKRSDRIKSAVKRKLRQFAQGMRRRFFTR